MCKNAAETVDHLLIRCPFVREVCNLLLSLFGCHWVFPGNARQVLLTWQGTRVNRSVKKAWNMASICLLWCTWKERNRRTFEDVERPLFSFKDSFLRLLYFWMTEAFYVNVESYVDFLGSLRL
uniref:Reverse transcriptase zinc-binding domain-containing protein n=1 Tax=Davidia involucrata TaxID=16924 RepID=A0A5B7CDX7_DAVIN